MLAKTPLIVQRRHKRRRRLLSILLAVAAMAVADVLGRLVVAAPVLLIPTLLLAGCVLAVADETPWGSA
jgi:hypothetical protein